MGMTQIIRKTGLFLALMFIITSCSDVPDIADRYRAEKMYHDANQLYRRIQLAPDKASVEQYRRVRESFEQIVAKYSAKSLREGNRYGQKVQEDLLTITGTSLMNVADLYFQEGHIDSAIITYEKVINDHFANHQLCSRAQYLIALGHQKSGRWSEAVAAFENLVETYPPFVETPHHPDMNLLQVPLYVAMTYLSQGDSTEANTYFQKARIYLSRVVAQWPGTPTAQISQNQIANTYVVQERWPEAVSAYRQLASMSERGVDPPEALFLMAAISWEKQGDLTEAQAMYEDIIQGYPGSEKLSRVYLALGHIFLQRGDLSASRQALRKVIDDFPADAQASASAQYAIALSYELEGDWDKALNEFRWIMDNYPYSPEALQVPNHIVEHYLQFGEAELAQSAYRQALRDYTKIVIENADTPRAAQAQWSIAQSHIQMKRWPEAARTLEELIREYPERPQVLISLLSLGEIYDIHLEQYDRAIEAYQRIVKLAPESQSAQIAIQRLDQLRGKLE